jgi:hypothetical protein
MMNNIQEKDWAEDSWGGHSGMGSDSDYCIVDDKGDDKPAEIKDDNEISLKE